MFIGEKAVDMLKKLDNFEKLIVFLSVITWGGTGIYLGGDWFTFGFKTFLITPTVIFFTATMSFLISWKVAWIGTFHPLNI